MRIKVRIHEEPDGGYWAEVPSIPGCATQGDTFEELLQNLYEAIEGCLSVDAGEAASGDDGSRVIEIAVLRPSQASACAACSRRTAGISPESRAAIMSTPSLASGPASLCPFMESATCG